MKDLIAKLEGSERAATLLDELLPHFQAIVEQLPVLRELCELAGDAENTGAKNEFGGTGAHGHAKLPTFSKAAYAAVIERLLLDNGGCLSRDDLRGLAEQHVAERGYCRKFLGKWFAEIVRSDLVEVAPGVVASCSAPAPERESAFDLAFMEGLGDVA